MAVAEYDMAKSMMSINSSANQSLQNARLTPSPTKRLPGQLRTYQTLLAEDIDALSIQEPVFEVSKETKRKCMLSELCKFAYRRSTLVHTRTRVDFFNYYFDLVSYIHMRRHRLGAFKGEFLSKTMSQETLSKEWKFYCGKERAHLRKLRTRMRMTSFQIVNQIGQGGYGKVSNNDDEM